MRFVRYDALDAFVETIPDLATHRSHRGFAYALSRGGSARVYVLAGRDNDALIDVVKKFAEMDHLPADGLLFVLASARSRVLSPIPR